MSFLYLFNSVGFGSVSWELLFLFWFQGRYLLGNDQDFKRAWSVKKGEDQLSKMGAQTHLPTL